MTVHFGRKSRLSGMALQEALNEAGYTGRSINYGLGINSDALNAPTALEMAVNKRIALETMITNDVPCPNMLSRDMLNNIPNTAYPLVGRPDLHSKGRGFWLCRTMSDVQRALQGTRLKKAATHFMEYIEGAREFRVHVLRDPRPCIRNSSHDEVASVCNGCKFRTIKISEKVGEVDITRPRNHAQGNAVFNYPDITSRERSTLRKAARGAVKALQLDFGAVDILFKEGKAYVLEVNTAPRLTDETADTLQKYVEAFMRYWNE